VAKVGTSNQDRTISLKPAVRICINKQTDLFRITEMEAIYCAIRADSLFF